MRSLTRRSITACTCSDSPCVRLASRKGSRRSSGRCSVCRIRYAASSKALSEPWPKNSCASLKRDTAKRSQSRTVIRDSVSSKCFIASGQEFFQRLLVNRSQLLDVFHRDVFVQLVDAHVERAELDHLAADVGDEAAVRGAAGGGQLGGDAGDLADRFGESVAQRAARGEERPAGQAPVDFVIEAVAVENFMHRVHQ